MAVFPHLPMPISARGNHRAYGGGPGKLPLTLQYERDRKAHAKNLRNQAISVLEKWQADQANRTADLPNEEIMPIFLRVDPQYFDADTLSYFGIDIVAEEENGYIIGTSADYFLSLRSKIDDYLNRRTQSKNKAAQLWEIIEDGRWRLDQILSEDLNAKWDQIADDELLLVDISIACALKIPTEPKKNRTETVRKFDARYKSWQYDKRKIEERRGDLEMQRQSDLDIYLTAIGATIVSDFVNFEDSFSCRISLSGISLKELVLRYQYLFDVTEYDQIIYTDQETGQEMNTDIIFSAPDANAPKVCIIDSGIHEQHLMLRDSIDSAASKSYVAAGNIGDEVANGGHGTKVAGGVLYGNNIPKTGTFKSDLWLQNAKVLNADAKMPPNLYPPQLMTEIVRDFKDARVFNLSINSFAACRIRHMSEWAAALDKMMYENDILFVVSAGNVNTSYGMVSRPGIQEYITSGNSYPDYLLESSCRIANPAQSCFAITVGSVCHDEFDDPDRKSFGKKDDLSSFSRCGLGLWGMIKPDVVEYGGDFIHEKLGAMLVTNHDSVGVEVVRSTYAGGNSIGHHVGTSFSTPKVSHIAASLLKIMPQIGALLVRALIAQGARLPEPDFLNPTVNSLRKYGYGIADKNRSIQNTQNRITLTGEGKISAKVAQIYSVKIPKEINRPGNNYNVLIEVTLSFVAKPRLTRRTTKSYLSTWVDWRSSAHGERLSTFERRMIKFIDTGDEGITDDERNVIKWHIRERSNIGIVKDCKRQDSTLQKDWVVIPAYQLPDEFAIAVIGHQGWDKDIDNTVPYALAVSIEALNSDINIYTEIQQHNNIEIELEQEQEVR